MTKQNNHPTKNTNSKLPPRVSPGRNSSSRNTSSSSDRSGKISHKENRKMEQEEQSENFGDNEGNF